MFTENGVRITLGIITVALLAVGVIAGLTSYRNWRMLSREPELIEAEGRERQEYMALFGLVVSASMVMGMIWFTIPIYIESVCVRVH
jgi:hypothetical protein